MVVLVDFVAPEGVEEGRIVEGDYALHNGDRVSVLPPIYGG